MKEIRESGDIERRDHWADNEDGWLLELTSYRDAKRFDRGARPVVMIPGYCMNTHIVGGRNITEGMAP